jgi:hypothetical protein
MLLLNCKKQGTLLPPSLLPPMLTSWALALPPSSAQAKRCAFTTHQPCLPRRESKNGGRHASDTDHADDDDAAAELPGVRRGRRPAARRLRRVVDRRLLRRAGRGARAHRAFLRLRPGVRRAGRAARRVIRLHQAGALAAPPRAAEAAASGCGGQAAAGHGGTAAAAA